MRSHFVAKLSLGLNDNKKPAYELDVVFDTSSGNVILPTVSCTGLPCKQRNLYDPLLTGAEVVTETPIGSRAKAELDMVDYDSGTTSTGFVSDSMCLGMGKDLAGKDA